MKVCLDCEKEFKTRGPNHKRCDSCKEIHLKEYHRQRSYANAVASGRIKNPGVGSGGTTGTGEDNFMWKNGYGKLKNHGIRRIRKARRYCEACDKDLKDVGRYHWCVHHIDHNTEHNEDDNLMLLCKSCHQIHHRCERNLPHRGGDAK